jgi:hypothetical protein
MDATHISGDRRVPGSFASQVRKMDEKKIGNKAREEANTANHRGSSQYRWLKIQSAPP